MLGSIDKAKFLSYLYTRLYLIPIAFGDIENIPYAEGVNNDPERLLNGHWIAFHSMSGKVCWLGMARFGLYDLRTNAVPRVQPARLSGFGCMSSRGSATAVPSYFQRRIECHSSCSAWRSKRDTFPIFD